MTQDVKEAALARADLCRFLSACYYEPTADFVDADLFGSIIAAATVLDPDLAVRARRLATAFAVQGVDELLVDYTRLFLGPLKSLASPYGSSWLSKPSSEADDPTEAIRELYAQGGFDLGDDFADLPDHVGVELEFLYGLLFNQHQAGQSGNTDELTPSRSLQQRLLIEHLGAWIGSFTEAVKAHAETAFYRELAELTERFIRVETDAFSS